MSGLQDGVLLSGYYLDKVLLCCDYTLSLKQYSSDVKVQYKLSVY